MRRWNGWGDDTVTFPLKPSAAEVLQGLLGAGTPPRDASLHEVVATVPPSRLVPHPMIATEPLDRTRHARGQSFPDLIALRSGQIPVFPDGVAYPQSPQDARELLEYAATTGTRLIPYGGGTSVLGHINPEPGEAPVLTIDMGRMSRLIALEPENRLATFGAGISGANIEAQLRARGFTLGHYPQSFELSTLGGWIATRSSGQQSLGYGRIEQLFAGGRVEAPAGTLELPPFPASAAGPELREMVLGSEGRLGIVTEATVRVRPLPEDEQFHMLFFPDWERALEATRAIIQAAIPLSMLRLSTPVETAMNLILAGRERLIAVLEKGLSLRGAGDGKCMLLVGFTGSAAQVSLSRKQLLALTKGYQAIHTGQMLGRQWQKGRFRAPYLRNDLWERGYAVETVETATTWERVPALLAALEQALREGLAEWGERVHVFTHLSHLYPQGSSIYTTYLFRLGAGAEETLGRWQALKQAASDAIVRHGGTISHQHGVGVDHKPWLVHEKGALGLETIRAVAATLDPNGLMNPGKLV